MKEEKICDAMNLLPDDIVHETEQIRAVHKKCRRPWQKWAAAAACLCLVVVGAVHILSPTSGSHTVLQWNDHFTAENYFKYNSSSGETSTSDSLADSEIPYAFSRYFSDQRTQFEESNMIPVISDYMLYNCVVYYNEDGSIFSINHSWHRYGDNYSTMNMIIGKQEVPQISDCIDVEIDANGNIVPPAVTVTERDGIQIVAQGNTLTFQNDAAWYQITGSGNAYHETMVELLDWLWEHPVDFDRFAAENGAEIVHASLADYPNAFAGQLPDFASIGYFLGENYLQLKDGIPFTFEGHYYTGIEEEKVWDGRLYDESGWTEIHWCVDAEPGYYDLQQCNGELSSLTETQIEQALENSSHFSFMVGDFLVKVYCSDSAAAWSAVASLQQRAVN